MVGFVAGFLLERDLWVCHFSSRNPTKIDLHHQNSSPEKWGPKISEKAHLSQKKDSPKQKSTGFGRSWRLERSPMLLD